MTVGELIQKLKDMPPDYAFVQYGECTWEEYECLAFSSKSRAVWLTD